MEQSSLSPVPEPPSHPEEQEEYYKGDAFRMSCMKVLPCSKRFVHDWTECPFAHPQEKARRRDPATHTYTGIACPSMKKEGSCAFGDHCPYAHNVFEYWLHPTRYRTQLCNDGSNCRRKICFFAHSLDELRVPACKPFVSPEALAAAAAAAAAETEQKRKSTGVVGSPVANLNLPAAPAPPRISADSVRQSLDWGPVPMPANMSAAVRLSSGAHSGGLSEDVSPVQEGAPDTPQEGCDTPATPSPQFNAHEQQVIETVTNMLAQDSITPPQAATILQQMLPAASLQLLQSALNNPSDSAGVRRAMSDPMSSRRTLGGGFGTPRQQHPGGAGTSLEQLAAMQAIHATGETSPPRGSLDSVGPRQSVESSRSSFDTARMSMDGRLSGEFSTPRGSMDYLYATPAPAYPQEAQPRQSASQNGKQRYWTGNQLSPVPEGLPMINTPPPSSPWNQMSVRHSTGNMDPDTAAQRLSSDFGRMSFDSADTSNEAVQVQQGGWAGGYGPPRVNPYASSFFGGGAASDW